MFLQSEWAISSVTQASSLSPSLPLGCHSLSHSLSQSWSCQGHQASEEADARPRTTFPELVLLH